jgi:hypothetical protein
LTIGDHDVKSKQKWVALFAISGMCFFLLTLGRCCSAFSLNFDNALVIFENHLPPLCPPFLFIANQYEPTRKGRGSIFTANTRLNKAPAAFRNLDYAEAHGRQARTLSLNDKSDTLF